MNRKSFISGEIKFNRQTPKHDNAFLLLSREMNTLSHMPEISLDWRELNELCQRIFRRHGYDIQTGGWYCLIQLRTEGWPGAANSLELFASALGIYDSQTNDTALSGERHRALEWFISHLITPMYTQYIELHSENIQALTRVESALESISHQAQTLKVHDAHMLPNLCYFLKVRARSSQSISLDLNTSQHVKLVCKKPDEGVADASLSQVSLSDTAPPQLIPPVADQRWQWLATGALASMLLMSIPAGGYWLFTLLFAKPVALAAFSTLEKLEEQFSDPAFTTQVLTPLQLNEVDEKLQSVAMKPASWLLLQGDRLAHSLTQQEPNNPVAINWQKMLSQSSIQYSQVAGWFEIQKRLNTLEQRLLKSEKMQRDHMTISELKTEVYEMKRALKNMDTPVTVLLWERAENKKTQHQDKVLNENIRNKLDNLNRSFVLNYEF